MHTKAISIRPFIGAKNFEISRSFYCDLGCTETKLSSTFSLFQLQQLHFYLQDAYVQDWIDNTMLFVEVASVELFWNELIALNLTQKYEGVKLVPIKALDWGKECFLHDPSGILWHFGEFN